mmetsp:Transcript_32725/g.64841  ORF Transcript_32725/g.64841 Transcript_32725/m.64841 type:complete len:226 (-) Transcript_32725:1052-1729(-)
MLDDQGYYQKTLAGVSTHLIQLPHGKINRHQADRCFSPVQSLPPQSFFQCLLDDINHVALFGLSFFNLVGRRERIVLHRDILLVNFSILQVLGDANRLEVATVHLRIPHVLPVAGAEHFLEVFFADFSERFLVLLVHQTGGYAPLRRPYLFGAQDVDHGPRRPACEIGGVSFSHPRGPVPEGPVGMKEHQLQQVLQAQGLQRLREGVPEILEELDVVEGELGREE